MQKCTRCAGICETSRRQWSALVPWTTESIFPVYRRDSLITTTIQNSYTRNETRLISGIIRLLAKRERERERDSGFFHGEGKQEEMNVVQNAGGSVFISCSLFCNRPFTTKQERTTEEGSISTGESCKSAQLTIECEFYGSFVDWQLALEIERFFFLPPPLCSVFRPSYNIERRWKSVERGSIKGKKRERGWNAQAGAQFILSALIDERTCSQWLPTPGHVCLTKHASLNYSAAEPLCNLHPLPTPSWVCILSTRRFRYKKKKKKKRPSGSKIISLTRGSFVKRKVAGEKFSRISRPLLRFSEERLRQPGKFAVRVFDEVFENSDVVWQKRNPIQPVPEWLKFSFQLVERAKRATKDKTTDARTSCDV